MFILDFNPEFTWPVTLRLPASGSHATHNIEARFRLLPESTQQSLTQTGGDLAVLRDALIGIEGVTDRNGTWANTREQLDAVLDLMPWRIALAQAYTEAVYGVPSPAALGN